MTMTPKECIGVFRCGPVKDGQNSEQMHIQDPGLFFEYGMAIYSAFSEGPRGLHQMFLGGPLHGYLEVLKLASTPQIPFEDTSNTTEAASPLMKGHGGAVVIVENQKV